MDGSASIPGRSTLLRATLAPGMATMRLRTIDGPVQASCDLSPGRVVVVGREHTCELALQHESVSRRHARIAVVGGEWTVTDLGSLNGTQVCGQAIRAEAPTPIGPGDTLAFGACVLRVSAAGATHAPTLPLPAPPERVRLAFHSQGELDVSSPQHVQRLTEAAVALGGATDIEQVGNLAVGTLLDATALAWVAFVVLEPGEREAPPVQTIARARQGEAPGADESAALITAAASLADATRFATLGQEAAPKAGSEPSVGSRLRGGSIRAVAAPVLADGRVVAVLLGHASPAHDARGTHPILPQDAALLLGVAQACGLAISRMHAVRVQQRLAALAQQLESARRAQSALLPSARGRVAQVRYATLFRPGEYVAGDFYDVVTMPGGRVACILGDVCGHGLASGLYMASLLTHLRDRLAHGEALLSAVASANALLSRLNGGAQRGGSAIVLASLWAAVVDPRTGEAECVDCGHGYAAITRPSEPEMRLLTVDGGPPLGVEGDASFGSSRVQFGQSDTLVLFSDGVVEQPDAGSGEQFGLARLAEAMRGLADCDAIPIAIEAALTRFAGARGERSFQDDVTVLALGAATE